MAEDDLMLTIGRTTHTEISAARRIYLKYLIIRLAGVEQETIISWGSFLNYSITWDAAERVYCQLSADANVSLKVQSLFDLHKSLCQSLNTIITVEE